MQSFYENIDTIQSFIILNAIRNFMREHSKIFHLDTVDGSSGG